MSYARLFKRVGFVLFLIALPPIFGISASFINLHYSLKDIINETVLLIIILSALIGYISIFFMKETVNFKVLWGGLYTLYLAYMTFFLGFGLGMSIGGVYP